MIMQASLENLLNNPFVNHFVDCIENLPNNLQYLISELRDIDSQVNVYHQKLNNFKETCCNESTTVISVEQLGIIHNTLIKCQELGDQKVELVSQIINLLDNKTKQLMLDTKTLDDRAFKIEIDEDKIVSEFKATIKQRSSSSSTSNSNHKESKNYNVVTKAMSKYMPQTSYEQNCISKSLNNHQTHENRLILNGSASNTLRQKYLNNQYHLPDRKAKKPRIDEQLTSTTKSTQQKTNENFEQSSHYSSTRSKRQLNYTTPQNGNKNNNLLINMKKKRLNLNNNQSSPSSSVSTSSSSSLSNRHRDYIRKAKLRASKKYKLSTNNIDDDDDEEDDSGGDQSNDEHPHQQQYKSNKMVLSNINENSNNNNSNDESSSSTEMNSQKNSDLTNNNQNILKNNVLSTIGNNNTNIEPNEPLYCVCRQISYGQMIMCDNSDCELEWFHFDCVKLSSKPKGKWYCPQCRGDNHKVMRKTYKK